MVSFYVRVRVLANAPVTNWVRPRGRFGVRLVT